MKKSTFPISTLLSTVACALCVVLLACVAWLFLQVRSLQARTEVNTANVQTIAEYLGAQKVPSSAAAKPIVQE
jgi:uncharacterized membrane protein YciS (DUF1049 family)